MVGGLRLAVVAAAAAVLLQGEPVPEVTLMQLEQDASLVGKTVKVVGRVEISNPRLIFLRNCRVRFRGFDLPRLPSDGNAALTGTLGRDEDRLVFRVQQVVALPSDAELFEQRYARQLNRHAALYELGDWARQRGDQYDDDALVALSRRAYERALELEEGAVPPPSADAMFALARRARELGVSASVVQRLQHHAHRRALAQTELSDAAALRKLAERIEADLVGAQTPTRASDNDLLQQYSRSPLEVYRNASQAQRTKLHRALWCDALESALDAEWQQAQRDGVALADEAAQRLPERDLADRLRRRAIERETADYSTLSRRRVLQLAEQHRLLGEPEAAEEMLMDWLAAQATRLARRDAERRVELADEYLHLGRNESPLSQPRLRAAQELLLEAWELTKSAKVAESLGALGLVLDESRNRWLKRDNYEQTEQAQRERQIRLGQIAQGMTGSDVLQARSRRPDAIVRFGSHERLEEQWIYETGEDRMLYINLVYARSAKHWVVDSFYVHP